MGDKLIEEIRLSILALEQKNMFIKQDSLSLEEACSKYLRFKGYKVLDPPNFKVNAPNLRSLIDIFYKLVNAKHPEYLNVYRNEGRDLAIAKRFVEEREKATGMGRELALKECAMIIKTIFDHEKEFKFNTNIYFGMFGQAKLSWVADKALQIMNKDIQSREDEDFAKKLESMEEANEEEYGDCYDLDGILKNLEEE